MTNDSGETDIRKAFNRHKETSLKTLASYYDFAAGYEAAERAAPQPVLSQPEVKAETENCGLCGLTHCDVCPQEMGDLRDQRNSLIARGIDPNLDHLPALCPLSDIPAQAEPGKAELLQLLAHFDRLGIKNRAAYERAIQDLRSAICFPASEGE